MPTEPKDLDMYLSDLYDLAARMRGLTDLHNRINKELPNCPGKNMIIGKIRAHIRQIDEEIQRTIDVMAMQWSIKP